MNHTSSVFANRHTFFAVIHVKDAEQALRNVRIATDEGADGIFLINHRTSTRHLLSVYHRVREQFPALWIGLNFLDRRTPISALCALPITANGLWIDDAGVREDAADPIAIAREFDKHRRGRVLDILYFGGVAFKYQGVVTDPAKAAVLAKPFVDVITTSGERTGSPPTVDKIAVMRKAIGPYHSLAIASGMTPENVRMFMPFVDRFLVATGVSDSDTELNARRVRKFALAMNS